MRKNELDDGISKPRRIRVKVIVCAPIDTLLNEADNSTSTHDGDRCR
jgi:hypothetical protein